MKIAITGGEGMFASDFIQVAEKFGHEVFPLSHSQMDVCSPKKVSEVLGAISPDMVLHTVGLAVDPLEEDPGLGDRVHVWGTGVVARQTERMGATLINLSTCGVFGDEVLPYSEYDDVVLKTEYARSKFLAESEAEIHCQKTFNIRPGWLYGGSLQHKKNFVVQRYKEALNSPGLKSANDKFGCPTHIVPLSEKILEIVETKEYGLYHVTSAGQASRYDYVKAIVEAFSLKTEVEGVDSSHYSRPASVPDCEVLENRNIVYLGLKPMANWQDALNDYIASIKSKL